MTMHLFVSLVVIAVCSGTVLSQSQFPVDPRATHLRTRNDPAKGFQPREDFIFIDDDRTARHVDPLSIELASGLPDQTLLPGDYVLLEAVGAYCFHNPTCHLLGTGMWGVFSTDGVLLDDGNKEIVQRIPNSVSTLDAVGAAEVVSVPDETWTTDVPHDFAISAADSSDRTVLRIPDGATHLMVSAPDVQWFDNFVPAGGEYSLRITKYLESSVTGEFSGDEQLTLEDIELLQAEVLAGTHNIQFDLNYDGLVDATDIGIWSVDLARTYAGDANLDGEFNTADLTSVFAAGQYEDGIARNSTWSGGDWNGDGDFDSSDLVLALSQGGFEQGPRLSAAPVPEPAALVVTVVAGLTLAFAHRRQRSRPQPASISRD